MGQVNLGLDIGGTKLAAGLVDAQGAVLRAGSTRTPSSSADDAEDVWSALVSVASEVMTAEGVDPDDLLGVGVGCGGPMQWPAGIVSPLNLLAWRDFPLRDRVSQWLPGKRVRLHNDAVCFAIAEHWCGAARGADAALGVVMSTGVGGGLLLSGRVVDGRTGNAGHIGHVFVELDGPLCGCGARGCLEAVARGPALVRWAVERGWVPDVGAGDVGPAEPTGVQLAAAARAGDPTAAAAFARAGQALARALASTTNLLDLDVAVIGGGLSNAGALLFDPLMEELDQRLTMQFARRLRVVPNELGTTAGVVGAAALVAAGDTYWWQDR